MEKEKGKVRMGNLRAVARDKIMVKQEILKTQLRMARSIPRIAVIINLTLTRKSKD